MHGTEAPVENAAWADWLDTGVMGTLREGIPPGAWHYLRRAGAAGQEFRLERWKTAPRSCREMPTRSPKPRKRVSFNDKVTFNSYQASYAVPLQREASITLIAHIDMPAKDISKLVPYKHSTRLKSFFKKVFSKRSSAPCLPPQTIVLR